MLKFACLGSAATVLLMTLSGCGSTPSVPASADARSRLDAETRATLAEFRNADPSLDRFFNNSYAYAVFPNVGEGGLGIGGGYGKGEVFQGNRMVGWADVTKFNVGLQAGGDKFAQLIFFQNGDAWSQFTGGTMELDAQAKAVAAKSGAATSADYQKGVAVFTLTKGGLMAQAAVGGQKFRFTPTDENVARDLDRRMREGTATERPR